MSKDDLTTALMQRIAAAIEKRKGPQGGIRLTPEELATLKDVGLCFFAIGEGEYGYSPDPTPEENARIAQALEHRTVADPAELERAAITFHSAVRTCTCGHTRMMHVQYGPDVRGKCMHGEGEHACACGIFQSTKAPPIVAVLVEPAPGRPAPAVRTGVVADATFSSASFALTDEELLRVSASADPHAALEQVKRERAAAQAKRLGVPNDGLRPNAPNYFGDRSADVADDELHKVKK